MTELRYMLSVRPTRAMVLWAMQEPMPRILLTVEEGWEPRDGHPSGKMMMAKRIAQRRKERQMTNENLREYLEKNKPGRFVPGVPMFNQHGKFMAVFWEDDDAYAERVSERVDVYRSMKTGTIVGVKVYGVTESVGEGK